MKPAETSHRNTTAALDRAAVVLESGYQISFMANWICLDGVITPAPGMAAPVASNSALKSSGGEKFGWLNILKTSTRNCALKVSDILLIRLFLNSDISKLISPGPVNWLRLELPRRFAQVPGMPGLPGSGGFAVGFGGLKP
jgi:hypothetical protein